MNLIKVILVVVLFMLAVLLALQNVDVLATHVRFGLYWPAALAFSFDSPVYIVLMVFFLIGFVLVALFALRRNRAQLLQLRALYSQIQTLKRKLQSEHEISSTWQSGILTGGKHQIHFQTETEQTTMDTSARPSADKFSSHQVKSGDEVLVKSSTPGWGAVLLLSAALSLVVGGIVYIVLSERLKPVAAQLGELSSVTGQLSSIQKEMGRSWEHERVAMRYELEAVAKSQAALLEEMGRLENQMRALSELPAEVRGRIVAGFLREAASQAAYLGSLVDETEQRDSLRNIHDLLQTLALELEGGDSQVNGEE